MRPLCVSSGDPGIDGTPSNPSRPHRGGYSPCPTGEGTEMQGALAVGIPPTTRLHPRAHPASFIFPTRHF